ncbi:MAG: SUMF1/EgtB/PvdO family nonheme iron enzyme [Pirellulales bacterium]|nr:SUMF1/EgtB/PvdO family nonheme iron enzyme [Pirellulales bacterium]
MGITRSGLPGSYRYEVLPQRGNRPVDYVGWYDALRFANWLHNGQRRAAQGPTTTEDDAYDMSRGASISRKADARVWLPSEDEWYKAAYYKGGGDRQVEPTCAVRSPFAPTASPPDQSTGRPATRRPARVLLLHGSSVGDCIAFSAVCFNASISDGNRDFVQRMLRVNSRRSQCRSAAISDSTML